MSDLLSVGVRSLNGLLMLAMPLALGVYLARRLDQRWGLYLAGALTFLGSQVLHLPFNLVLLNPRLQLSQGELTLAGVVSAAVLGLSAGVFEESARYLVLRFWKREARSWRAALMFGAGHGGFESMVLGVLVLLTLTQMIAYRGVDLSSVVPLEQLDLAQQQIDSYWAASAPLALLGAVERLFALCLHLSLSVLVMRVFTHGSRWWLVAAIGWHALVDALAVLSVPQLGAVATEGVIGLTALVSVALILRLRDQTMPTGPTAAAIAPPAGIPADPIEASPQSIERSRFSDG